MKRVLITGGAGFIGSHTVDLLLQQNIRVNVLDNLSTGKITNLNLFHPQLEFIPGDVLDYPLLLREVKKSDAVLHLAALASVPQSIEDPLRSLQVNTAGFLSVLQAIRDSQKPIRLVYASSAAVYGSGAPLPCSDALPLSSAPLSPYALEKANNERYADLYAILFGIKSLGLRYFNVYGSRQDPKSPYSGVMSRFIECYKNQQPITILGNGEQSRDFIHVTDIARANALAIASGYCGVLNIATGTPETLLNLVSYIETAGNSKAKLQFADSRPGDILQSYASVDKARQQLDFSASIKLEQGVQLLLS